MTEIATTGSTELSVLNGLAQEAQFYIRNIANNMLQLGRVLTEAKALVRHGEWANWLRDNTSFSTRYAQQFMQAYERYGSNEAVAQIGERGKILKLLALPEGTEEQFFAENDVANMSTREVDEAVRKVREEMGAQLEAEREARRQAEAQAAQGVIPDYVQEKLDTQAQSIKDHLEALTAAKKAGNEAIQEANRLRAENASLQQEVAEQEVMLAESQEEYNRLQADLLNMQSMAAKGDAERVPVDSLDLNAFAGAVRQFMGICARMPQMRNRFSVMPMNEKNEWDELLMVIENWAVDARKALHTMEAEGVVHYE